MDAPRECGGLVLIAGEWYRRVIIWKGVWASLERVT